MRFDVVTIGSATLDVFLRTALARLVETPQGETDRFLAFPYGSKCEVEKLVVSSGGGGTNTAVGFARLGLKVAVVARCGWDFAGKIVREEIKTEKVADVLLAQLEGEETDYSTILLGPDGGRTILVYRGGTRLQRSLVDFGKLEASWFYTSSLEGNLDLLVDLTAFAQKKGIKIAANPGRREIEQVEKLLKIAKDLEVLLVNREEAARLTGLAFDDQQVCAKLFGLLPKVTVVVTEGESGVRVNVPGKGVLTSEGFRIKMVDATGAGDGFGCGLVAGLAKGWEWEKALKLGAANGAAVVTQIGAKAGLIREAEIESWLDRKLEISWEK